jgi:hypothetical protein
VPAELMGSDSRDGLRAASACDFANDSERLAGWTGLEPAASGVIDQESPTALQGTVKLTSFAAMWGVIATANVSSRCRGVPRNESARTQKSLMVGTELMSSNGEQVTNGVVDREEPLGVCHRFEAPHMALALAGRLV